MLLTYWGNPNVDVGYINDRVVINLSYENTTIRWFGTIEAIWQGNENNNTYYYLAI